MSDMKQRFTRAYNVLVDEYSTWNKESKQDLLNGCVTFDGMWLRNEAKLWEDYEEDESWFINDVACDPNHPDNLSKMVITYFLELKELGL